MTLDEYIAKLQSLSDQGHGNLRVAIFNLENEAFSCDESEIEPKITKGKIEGSVYLTKDPATFEEYTESECSLFIGIGKGY